MLRLSALLLPAVLFVSCNHMVAFRGEDFSYYYPPKSDTEEEAKVDQKMIKTWHQSPIHKNLIGWLEEWQYRAKGDRKWRTIYHIYDKRGLKLIGYITEHGEFYRYGDTWKPRKIGEWDVLKTGLKVFFDVPLNINVDLEEIDPYTE